MRIEIFVSRAFFRLTIMLLIVVFSINSAMATEWGIDLLNGIGDFETSYDRAAWKLHTYSGDSSQNRFDMDLPHTGDWSWHVGPSVAYGNTWGMWTDPSISTVANREHCLIVYARSQTSTPSWINYVIGGSGWQPLSYYTTVWGYNEKYYTSGATENTMEVAFKMHANSANDNGYIDGVALYRERCLPDPNSDSVGGIVYYGISNTFSIFGSLVDPDKSALEFKRAFDPDITISCDDANIHSVTWINDYQIDVELTPESDNNGTIELVLSNVYSALSNTYSMKVDTFGVDILDGIGNFESSNDRSSWSMNGICEFATSLPYDGNNSWHAGPSTAYGNQMTLWTNSSVSTVDNRNHRLVAHCRSQTSTPSWFHYAIGHSGYQELSYYTTVWGTNNKYYTTEPNETSIDVAFKMHANSANDNMYLDAVSLHRERCLPEPNGDSFGGLLPYGQRCEFSIYSDGQSDGIFNRKFDPDITVISQQATIYDVNWVNDNRIDVNMVTICGFDDDVNLVLTNVYSGLSSRYTMKYIYGADLLNGAGDFDDPDETASIGDRTCWAVVADSNINSEFSTTDYNSSSWSWYSEGESGNGTAILTYTGGVQSFGNREHRFECVAKKVNTPSAFTVEIGQGLPDDVNLSSNQWISSLLYYDSNTSETNLDLVFEVESDSSGDAIYLDDVSLRCQRSIPCPNSNSLTGNLAYEVPTVVSIYGESGYNGYAKKAFDPDIEVYSDEAYIESVTWVSDTQIDVNLTAFYGGNIILTLVNKYSGLQVDYNAITVNPPVGVFTGDTNEFPIFFFAAKDANEDYELARKCGSTHIHSWNHCVDDVNTSITKLKDFMDIAQEYGMKVVPYLCLHNWIDEPNGLSDLEDIATAVKDYNGMSFWHLVDEPEKREITADDIEPFYDMLKDLTPSIPVGITHAWAKETVGGKTYNWYDYDDVQDIFMNDLSIIHDEPFPTQSAKSLLNWNRQVENYSSSCQYFLPQIQSYNRLYWGVGTWSAITPDCRYPTDIEIRNWAFSSVIQGARGISWYGYYQAIIPEKNAPIDRTWLKETFLPVGRELRKFSFLTKPCHDPNVILDGDDTDDLYMSLWDRQMDTFVVLTNGDSTERQVTIDTTGYIDEAELNPWGLTRDVKANIIDSELTVYLKPWEVLIWTAE